MPSCLQQVSHSTLFALPILPRLSSEQAFHCRKKLLPTTTEVGGRVAINVIIIVAFRSFPLLVRLPLAFAPFGNKRAEEGIALLACTYRPGCLTMLECRFCSFNETTHHVTSNGHEAVNVFSQDHLELPLVIVVDSSFCSSSSKPT